MANNGLQEQVRGNTTGRRVNAGVEVRRRERDNVEMRCRDCGETWEVQPDLDTGKLPASAYVCPTPEQHG